MTAHDPQYIVFIRVPFPRGSFVDPPFVDWDASKDKNLWKILSNTSKNSDIDWNKLATKFDVPLTFLLQQIACLYERQMQQVQAQIRKVRETKGLSVPPIAQGNKSDSTGEAVKVGYVATGIMQEHAISTRGPSIGSRISPALAYRKDTTGQIPTSSNAIRLNAASISRNNSAIPIIESLNSNPSSPRPLSSIQRQVIVSPKLKGISNSGANSLPRSSPSNIPSSSESSSTDSSSESELSTFKSVLHRPSRFTPKPGHNKHTQEEEELVFMPLAKEGEAYSSSITKIDSRNKITSGHEIDTSIDLAKKPGLQNTLTSQNNGKGKEISDGAPSMGSSFSDLEDTSITQSALEEALASNMQAGGMASRMSSISQALRSRYL
ncbi:Autophagy-related protein 29 [Erysiphe neolycopersici]|uniref:Autophagy-related protein 29 n=1 Tax=Erysiphe neolycopersici TaxID=212602 RepID=A0A420I5Z8_9PEZI|nr:Autophagy-related protein 29 [Erysiphe neolycopersici]